MDVTAIRQAVATQISSVIGSPLTAYWYVPDSVTEPAVYIKPKSIAYDRTMRNTTETMEFEIVIVCSRADDVAGQTLLDQYIHGTGSNSVKAAIEAGRAQYGGTAYTGVLDDLWVSAVDAYQWYVLADTRYLGATLSMTVIGKGTT